MRVDVEVSSPVSSSYRARALEGMFDVPRAPVTRMSWSGEIPIEDRDWQVGLIVGPSGSGKSTITRSLFGEPTVLTWDGVSVVDDFAEQLSMAEIADVCQAVGFNTIPAWLRPHAVLSTGEQFRVEIARRMLETPADRPIVIDEFTSVVDRQVAKIGAHAAQKYARKHARQFVAVSCHYDVEEWLRPDWVFEPAMMQFTWGSDHQSRPPIDVTISPVPYELWRLFAPFHYLTRELNRSARCWCLFVDGQPAAFAGVLHRPHPKANDIKGVSRLVTLPDWQGLGLAFVLVDYLGAVYKAASQRLRTYPAHPALMHAFDRSTLWRLAQRPMTSSPNRSSTRPRGKSVSGWKQAERPNATFEYIGPAGDPSPLQWWTHR